MRRRKYIFNYLKIKHEIEQFWKDCHATSNDSDLRIKEGLK